MAPAPSKSRVALFDTNPRVMPDADRRRQSWAGVDADQAAKWTGAVFHCITYDSAQATAHTFDELVHEQTPGGINEQVIREMTEAGAYTALSDSLDGVLARIEARPPPKRTKRPYESTDE